MDEKDKEKSADPNNTESPKESKQAKSRKFDFFPGACSLEAKQDNPDDHHDQGPVH